MKTTLVTSIATMTVLVSLAIPGGLAAQDSTTSKKAPTQHHHYQLIDLATLGGPNSFPPEVFSEIDNGTAGARVISDAGAVIAQSDTSSPDPRCYSPMSTQDSSTRNPAAPRFGGPAQSHAAAVQPRH